MAEGIQNITVGSPTGGWNKRDSISGMDQADAITMDNFVSTGGFVKVRGGFQQAVDTLWEFDIDGPELNQNPIETIAQYVSGTKKFMIFTRKRITADGVGIYKTLPDVDKNPTFKPEGGIVDVSPVNSTGNPVILKSTMWKDLLFQGRLFFMSKDGDEPIVYTGGTNFIPHAFTIEPDVMAKYHRKRVEEFDFGNLWDICAYKKRLFLIEKGTLNLWFTVQAGMIAGPLDLLDLSDYAKKGGEVVGIEEWTRTGANDMSSMLVVLTSEGEVFMFSGMDPTDMDEWQLNGSYQIPTPIGYRCITKQMGDLVFATRGGYYLTSSVVSADTVGKDQSLSDKIRGAISGLKLYYDNIGWQVVFLQSVNYMIINIPISSITSQQFVLNLENQTWSRFTGINATTFISFGDEVYFGGKRGNIYRLFSGGNDNGVQINATCMQAFSLFEDQNKKHVRSMILMMGSAYDIEVKVLVSVDFNLQAVPCSIHTTGIDQNDVIAQWNKAPWDRDLWGSPTKAEDLEVQALETAVYSVPGRYFSVGIQLQPFAKETNDVVWHSSVFHYEQEKS